MHILCEFANSEGVGERFASMDRVIKRRTLKNALRLSLSATKGTAYLPFSHSLSVFSLSHLSISLLSFSSRPLLRLDRQAKHLRSYALRKCSNYGNYNAPSYTDGLGGFFSKNRISSKEIGRKLLNPAERSISKFYSPIETIYRFSRTSAISICI